MENQLQIKKKSKSKSKSKSKGKSNTRRRRKSQRKIKRPRALKVPTSLSDGAITDSDKIISIPSEWVDQIKQLKIGRHSSVPGIGENIATVILVNNYDKTNKCALKTFQNVRGARKIAKNEIKILKEIEKLQPNNCRYNIIQFCNETQKNARDADNIYIWLEYNSGSISLDKWIKSPENTKNVRIKITSGLSNGIQCLHQMGIVHRDIKPSNIIVNKNKVKIIDFGSSASVTLGTLRKINKKEGYTKQYHPPLFNDDDIDDNNQLFSIGSFYDIWSIMIICTEMVHKRPSEFYTILDPELKENFEDAFGYYLTSQEIKDNKFKENFNKLLGDLMYSKTLKKKWEQLFDYDYSVQCDVSSLDNGILIPLKNLPWYCRIISDLKKDDLILETVAHKMKMKDIAHFKGPRGY